LAGHNHQRKLENRRPRGRTPAVFLGGILRSAKGGRLDPGFAMARCRLRGLLCWEGTGCPHHDDLTFAAGWRTQMIAPPGPKIVRAFTTIPKGGGGEMITQVDVDQASTKEGWPPPPPRPRLGTSAEILTKNLGPPKAFGTRFLQHRLQKLLPELRKRPRKGARQGTGQRARQGGGSSFSTERVSPFAYLMPAGAVHW